MENKQKFNVSGMTCAACSARVEKAVSKLDGVSSCSVNLLTNSMQVTGTVSTEEIKNAVDKAGYKAESMDLENSNSSGQQKEEDIILESEESALKLRLISSLIFLLILMYFSMGYSMWGFPIPEYFSTNPLAVGLLQLLISAIIMVINQRFFISGFKAIKNFAPNMDTLVALGAGASFVYSVGVLFQMSTLQVGGSIGEATHLLHELYFESAAMILALITVGKTLEAHAKGKTTDALKSLMLLAPKTATILRDEKEQIVPVSEVKKGDIFIVKPGESIPVDGIILEGHSAINESLLTGESIPVDKGPDDFISAATINQSGNLTCRAERIGADTTLAQIIQLVSDAAATKAPISKLADKVSSIFVPVVILISIITGLIWFFVSSDLGYTLTRAVAVLVISCPCALGLATPVSIMVGSGKGAKNGILFKTAASLEEAGRISTVALDKTGTITQGLPNATDIISAPGTTETELLTLALALEQKSEHPLAQAIVKYTEPLALSTPQVSDFKAMPGNGLQATIAGEQALAGNAEFISKAIPIPAELMDRATALALDGKTPLFFAKGDRLQGIIAVADTIKKDSVEAINELKKMGIRVIMLTGDNEKTANVIGKQVGVDEVYAGIKPGEKELLIRKFMEAGKTAMVGDGINDAPALTRANIGIAIGAGTDIAIDAADVVLMTNHLKDVPAAIRLSRGTLRAIKQNLFWAFIYNVIGIPLAAGVFISTLGWELNPMFGAAAMSLSSFCVVTNALRLNLINIYKSNKDKKLKYKEKENKAMKKIMVIEGMMCAHCEARVKKVLEAMPEVNEAEVSHEKGTAIVTLGADLSDEALKKIIEDQDYKVISIDNM